MLGRLLIGLVKGILVGGLVGFGLYKLDPSFAAPGPILAYLSAAVSGVLVGLIAGKPIWAKDAKLEAGMKAIVGAGLGAALMFAARKWLTMPLPIALGPLAAANTSLGEASQMGTLGGLAITSLAAVAAVLGGFYEADNTPGEASAPPPKATELPTGKKRIAAAASEDADDEAELEHASEKKQERGKR